MRTIRVRAALPGVRPLPAPPRVTVPAAMTLTSMLVPAATTASPSATSLARLDLEPFRRRQDMHPLADQAFDIR